VHYSNECEAEEQDRETKVTKIGSNFLVLKNGTGGQSNIEEENEDDSNDKDENSYRNGHIHAFLQHYVACSIQDEAAIPKEWILLDSQSTVDMFSNGSF